MTDRHSLPDRVTDKEWGEIRECNGDQLEEKDRWKERTYWDNSQKQTNTGNKARRHHNKESDVEWRGDGVRTAWKIKDLWSPPVPLSSFWEPWRAGTIFSPVIRAPQGSRRTFSPTGNWVRGHTKSLPKNQKTSTEILAGKVGQGCTWDGTWWSPSSAHCRVSSTPFFQHRLAGLWSYKCTFLLPKPESQKFRNA